MEFIYVSENKPCAVGVYGKRQQRKVKKYGGLIMKIALYLATTKV